MPHSLIIGTTESGKTTLAKRLALKYRASGIGALVLDPLRDPSWPCDFITDNSEEFLKIVFASRKCALFIDEAGESVGRFDQANFTLATRARHWGHNSHFIAQRAQLVARTVRDQCSNAFVFRVAREDAKILAADWCADEVMESIDLPAGQCFYLSRFAKPKKIALW